MQCLSRTHATITHSNMFSVICPQGKYSGLITMIVLLRCFFNNCFGTQFQCVQAVINIRHYSDVIMSALASQITCVSIVCSNVCSGADQRKHPSSSSLVFVRGKPPVTGGFPSQRVSYAENVSICWRHHVLLLMVWHHYHDYDLLFRC